MPIEIKSKEDNIEMETVVPEGKKEETIPEPVLSRADEVLEFDKELTSKVDKRDEVVAEIATSEDPLKADNGKKKSRQQVCDEIKMIEEKLGIKHQGLSRWSREDIDKRLVSLIEQLGKKIQEDSLTEKIGSVDEVNNAKSAIQTEIKKDMERQKKVIQVGMEAAPAQSAPAASDMEYANFLYRSNFIFNYAIENLTKVQHERGSLAFSLEGLSDEMASKKEDLMPIYRRLFAENKEFIKQYGSPLMELMFVNLTMASSIANKNALKKKKQ